MYAAAGGLSLAKRQERRNLKKQNSSGEAMARAYKPPPSPVPGHLNRSHVNLRQQQHLHHLQHLAAAAAAADDEEGRQHRHLLDLSYAELNGRITAFGSSDMFPESQQGKAAWQERDRERRSSVTEVAVNHRIKATEAHRRWMKRNRIHDSSYGGSSSDDDDYPGGVYGHQSAAANGLLYVGLGTVAIGLVIFFVGTGEKGFKTLELRLIGPSLIAGGVLCCLVRVFLCVCPSRCLRRRRRRRRHKKPGAEGGPACPGQDIPMADRCSLIRKDGGDQCPLKGDIVTTTLFLQNEKRPPGSRPTPTINLPNVVEEDVQQPCTSRQRRGPADHREEELSLLAGEDDPEPANSRSCGRTSELVLSPSKLQP